MNLESSSIISAFLKQHEQLFTIDFFYKYLKEKGVKISRYDAEDILRSSDYVFPLVNQEFVTKAGVFTGRWFSFKPSKEEIKEGYILIGHRTMPFSNIEVAPDELLVFVDDNLIKSEPVTFSMNLAMDVFSLFGEGYIIPYIFNDKSNTKLALTSVQYSLPSEITLTAWPLKPILKGEKIEYGDRILCRVVDWESGAVEMSLQKCRTKKLVVSEAEFQREEWYEHFEQGLLDNFDKHGPTHSIEEQLSLLFLEHQEELCIENCGSVEEFLAHTTKIGFEPYGVESRIWKKGQQIPYTGAWVTEKNSAEILLSDMALNFSPQVIDAYLENNLFMASKSGQEKDVAEIIKEFFPQVLRLSPSERKVIILNIEKRNDILKKRYNRFSDFSIADLRKRVIDLFTQVNTLFCDIGCSGLSLDVFPQQELVILSQLYSHVVHLLEEIENEYLRSSIPIDDVTLSLSGMEETFEDIEGTLADSLSANRYKGYGIIKND